MTEVVESEIVALKMARTEYSQKIPGILLTVCLIFFVFLLMSGGKADWFGVPHVLWVYVLCGASLLLWSQFEFYRYVVDESMQYELGGFPPITVCNKPIAFILPAQYKYDPKKKERVLWCPRIKIIHLGGTMFGNLGIHYAGWPDVPGVEVDTARGKKVHGDFRIKTFSSLRDFLKPIFVDEYGNNVSPSRKYKPGKSLFFIAERVTDIVKYESMDFGQVLDIADKRATELEKIIRQWQDLSPKQKEEAGERIKEGTIIETT